MQKWTGAEIRQMFLDFFKEKGHDVEPSASLVPHEDPTLLWINSGVATLKKYFDGRVIPQNPRIVNAQKSIRTNDIENVGKTARHHTFFEMLGNFSIGEYFKEEAIEWAWEFLTSPKWIGFEREKLSVTVHPEDHEAFNYWRDKIGIPEERIIRLEGNFWDIGEGPSGPNTEIFFDRGEKYGSDLSDPELYPGGENDRYLEIWNLVFSQFNHNPDHTYTPLPKKNIDTGMGLERMACVVQDVETNFETDLFMPIIKAVEKISGEAYNQSSEKDVAFKVIADHVRTVSFAIGDGALPSNEGRGYVLRRLLRRAVRYAKQIGVDRPFMHELVPVVGDIMIDFYPEVKQKEDFIRKVIKTEEERFHETLNEGLSILSGLMEIAKSDGSAMVSGKDVFRLYDTFGFPVELTEEYAVENGLRVDHEGFEEEMNLQRQRARAARQDGGSMQVQGGILGDIKVQSEFVGYNRLAHESAVEVILINQEKADQAGEGAEVQLILTETPFYAESGGQVGDQGVITNDQVKLRVTDVKKAPNGQNLHTAIVEEGTLCQGDTVKAFVDPESRTDITKNHTATHLLHQALKDVLGGHVNQAGSLVQPDRLRFDFTHFGPVQPDELNRIEEIVNQKVWENFAVETANKSLEEAKSMGAMALFGEKYGAEVRVVSIGDYSLELCGGCHVASTSSIGLFRILSEGGIGAGTRRIEAVTGEAAYRYMNDQIQLLNESAGLLKTNPKELAARIQQLQSEMKGLQRENESLHGKISNIEAKSIMERVVDIDGVKVLAEQVQVADAGGLRSMADDVKNKLGSGVLVLVNVQGEKVQIIAGVTKDLIEKGYHAGKLVKEVAARCGGGGGGRPDMAQAGGKDPSKVQEALQFVPEWVKSI
ncbi:alanine--tRNA ligase [Jeotgalibacillus proteolyticus]|uniref:Alanine--tRNA ligase n=1 Tax=Jeotgalibacillus proteolyticus TaxID=2082395 RepID=A0A2S5GEQ2_9BACL|nr:alanine--tRNA ligase [Jeotgalibacillus proteolyticus]PPA71500.1 alanine--tRNA ligase [Jeotgalibacillus proteolyticus]